MKKKKMKKKNKNKKKEGRTKKGERKTVFYCINFGCMQSVQTWVHDSYLYLCGDFIDCRVHHGSYIAQKLFRETTFSCPKELVGVFKMLSHTLNLKKWREKIVKRTFFSFAESNSCISFLELQCSIVPAGQIWFRACTLRFELSAEVSLCSPWVQKRTTHAPWLFPSGGRWPRPTVTPTLHELTEMKRSRSKRRFITSTTSSTQTGHVQLKNIC